MVPGEPAMPLFGLITLVLGCGSHLRWTGQGRRGCSFQSLRVFRDAGAGGAAAKNPCFLPTSTGPRPLPGAVGAGTLSVAALSGQEDGAEV